MSNHTHGSPERTTGNHYRLLVIMTVVSFIAMYALMYAMVNRSADVYNNFNQVYMAGLMAAAMVIIELALMRAMYPNSRRNTVLFVVAGLALLLFWLFIRGQTAISDRQFLRSMIPHHSSAILMCQQASVRDPRILQLCEGIVSSQQSEIDQMKGILGERQAGRTALPAGDSAAVGELVDRYHRALSTGDTGTAMSLLGDDAVILESGESETREQYRTGHLGADIAFARAVPSEREPVRVVVSGDAAWASSASRAQGSYRGRRIDSQGAELMVLTRQRDGWRIRAIHWSSRSPSR